MEFLNKRNTLLILAALLVILMAFMALSLIKKGSPQTSSNFDQEMVNIQTQSNSNSLDSIENDLESTDVDNLDSELQNIEQELNATN